MSNQKTNRAEQIAGRANLESDLQHEQLFIEDQIESDGFDAFLKENYQPRKAPAALIQAIKDRTINA